MPVPKGTTNNPNGRPVGSKNVKSAQWELLHEDIVGMHADKFNANMRELLSSSDVKRRVIGMEMYIKVLEYFKPKQARNIIGGDETAPPVTIVIQNPV
jgi:hypothetical protein